MKACTSREYEYILWGDGAYEPENHWPRVDMTVELHDKTYQWERSKESYRAQTKTIPRDICHATEQLTASPQAILPIICYQSAARVWSQKRKKQANTFSRKRPAALLVTSAA